MQARIYLAIVLAVAALSVLLSACGGSSSPQQKAEAGAAQISEALEEQATENKSQSAAVNPNPELEETITGEIEKTYGSAKEYEVGGGVCVVDKINTSETAVAVGGEAVPDHMGNASVLVSPLINANGETPTTQECQAGIAKAIG
jgi:hypothetical protein